MKEKRGERARRGRQRRRVENRINPNLLRCLSAAAVGNVMKGFSWMCGSRWSVSQTSSCFEEENKWRRRFAQSFNSKKARLSLLFENEIRFLLEPVCNTRWLPNRRLPSSPESVSHILEPFRSHVLNNSIYSVQWSLRNQVLLGVKCWEQQEEWRTKIKPYRCETNGKDLKFIFLKKINEDAKSSSNKYS